MNSKRIGRIMICLLLVCALVVNISPIKAEASVTGTVIASAAAVSVPVAVWAAAALIAIGVTVDWATDPNYNSYDALVDNVSTFLTNTGTYVKDGMIDMYRVVDETGKAVFYAAGDAMEAVRGWLFSNSVIYANPNYGLPVSGFTLPAGTAFNSPGVNSSTSYVASADCQLVLYYNVGDLKSNGRLPIQYFINFLSPHEFTVNGESASFNTGLSCYSKFYTASFSYLPDSSELSAYLSNLSGYHNITGFYTGTSTTDTLFVMGLSAIDNTSMYLADGLTLGQVSTVPIDGTGAREWSEEYTNNGLYIVGTGGSGNNNPNNGKWFWPLAFGLTAAELYAMSQADQWAAETPAEFDQYETKEEFAVSPGTEVEFGQSIVLSPSIDSETGGVAGGEVADSATWFQKVIEGITGLPQKIANAFKTLLQELFVPDAEFISNKVEALKAEYKFLDPILSTGEDLKLFFQNIGSQPPIIWIDLGAGTGWHPMGGKVKFIDLTWYAQYKPTVDPIVGGFIWLWLAWRFFKAVPDLLAGGSGTVGAPTIAPDIAFNPARLPAGRSRRKKDGE